MDQISKNIFDFTITPEIFSTQNLPSILTIHKNTLDYFNGTLPDLDEYISSLRSFFMDASSTDVDSIDLDKNTPEEIKAHLANKIMETKAQKGLTYPSNPQEIIAFTVEVFRGLFQLGPLYDLLEDEDVTDIMIHKWDLISVARRSTGSDAVLTDKTFTSSDQMRTIMQSIMSANSKQINKAEPIQVGIEVASGARIIILDDAVSPLGMVAGLRKQSTQSFTPEDLIRFDAYTDQVSRFLELSVKNESNIVVVGSTGSGKTTLLSACMHYIPKNTHTVIIEDTVEIQIPETYKTVTRTCLSSNTQDNNVGIYDLLKASLRLNPTYIFVGETRGSEAWSMLQAMKSGHAGITTIHADDGPDALTRLEGMMSLASNAAKASYLRQDIAEVMDLFIIQGWVGIGKRKRRGIRAIYEITPSPKLADVDFESIMPANKALSAEDIYNNNPHFIRAYDEATLRTLYYFDVEKDKLVAGVLPSEHMIKRFTEKGLTQEYLAIRSM